VRPCVRAETRSHNTSKLGRLQPVDCPTVTDRDDRDERVGRDNPRDSGRDNPRDKRRAGNGA